MEHSIELEPAANRPRLLLADGHQMVAEGLGSILERYFGVVGILSDASGLFATARNLDPDVMVLDISMLSLNGVDAVRQVHEANLRAKLVFIAGSLEVTCAARALEAGAAAYVLKHSSASELVTAIKEVLAGRRYISPQMAGALLDLMSRRAEPPLKLTSRQREVLRLVVEGRSAKEVAAALSISRRTAEFHKARLMVVLGVQNTAQLIHYAMRAGAQLDVKGSE